MLGFRVWDNEEKIFLDDEALIFVDIDSNGELRRDSLWKGRYIPMQSTGLTAFKGAEIFEGDIVIVEMGMTDYKIEVKNVTDFLCEYGQDSDGDRPRMFLLGNIYENPELLEKVK